MVTAKDIAEIAKVSRSTVQRALAGNPNISLKNREKILGIAKELGYKPDKTARSLVMKQQSITFGVIFINQDNPFYIEVSKGINKAMSEMTESGIQFDIHYMKELDAVEQSLLIHQMVDKGHKGIVFIPIDDPKVQKEVQYGISKGVRFITMISDIPDTGRLCFIGQDHYQSGLVAGCLMSQITNKGDKIACFLGSHRFLAHRQRLQGFKKRFSEKNDSKQIVSILENMDSNTISQNLVPDLLEQHSDLKGIFIIGAGTEGICQVVKEKGFASQVKIICYDITPERVQYCKEGIIDFFIDQDPFNEGYKAINLLYESVFFNEEIESSVYSKIEIKTMDNL